MSIKPDFSPESYFSPTALANYYSRKVRGSKLRDIIRPNRGEQVAPHASLLFSLFATFEKLQARFEALHPSHMGGNYLPQLGSGEVEVARLSLASSTTDTFAVYAVRSPRGVLLRMVDEYGGDTLAEPRELEVGGPLTLEEISEWMLSSIELVACCEHNCSDAEEAMDFFRASSAFYPGLNTYLCQKVKKSFPATSSTC